MDIKINEQKLKLSDRLRQKITNKFNNLEKYLRHYQKDLKVASLSIEKIARSGFQIKFDMNLPGLPVNIKDTHRVLIDGVVRVRNKAKRQVKKYLEKLHQY